MMPVSAGEKGENVWVTGEATGTSSDERGGDKGLCGGGVTAALGVPHSEEAGDRAGDELRGDCCPYTWSDVAGDAAEVALFSTSRKREDKNVGSSVFLRPAAALEDSACSVCVGGGRRNRGLFS